MDYTITCNTHDTNTYTHVLNKIKNIETRP